ncbi:MAG TPA: orotidine-5'-phosphate decarboxylase [Gammaproteobacteria bacterium]|nr:orotidine-5'-phosphate decarboxylase [Gammaproteobacteria bacterium]
MPPKPPRIIVALDVSTQEDALALASSLDPRLCRVKVGKELFTRIGPRVVEALQNRGFGVFLDLKFHDIPDTVAGACRAAAALEVWMVNVHATGGRRMMEAAREAVEASTARPLLTAVTILTSLDAEDLAEIGLAGSPGTRVIELARLAEQAGLDGAICSPRELEDLKGRVSDDFLRVTPGIRAAGSARGDQKRVMTPAQATRLGAHYLVIGRPITEAEDPGKALETIAEEMERGA